jgi:serine/threonine protein phosphatase PrpC
VDSSPTTPSPSPEFEILPRKESPPFQDIEQLHHQYKNLQLQHLSRPPRRRGSIADTLHYAFFAVYDGHGGTLAAEYVHHHLHRNVVDHPRFEQDPETAIREGFAKTDRDLVNKVITGNCDGLDGTTASVALIFGNVLWIANVGDSAAVLFRDGESNTIIPLTEPHTAANPKEKQRVEGVGGVVTRDRLGHPAWNPNIINVGVTRAFGDVYFKHPQWTNNRESGLMAEPEITKTVLTVQDRFLLLATDGFWAVVSPQEAVELVKMQEDKDPTLICKDLTNVALARSTLDNVTVLIVKLCAKSKPAPPSRQ